LAARLCLAGASSNDDWSFAPDEYELVGVSVEDVLQKVKRRDVLALITAPLFVSAWRAWSRYRRFGLAHGQGSDNERPLYIRAIEVLEQEFEGHQADEMENKRG